MAEVPLFIPDANAALRWLLPHRELHSEASAMIGDFAQGRIGLFVPYHFPAEVGGGVRKAIANRGIPYSFGRQQFQEYLATGIPVETMRQHDFKAFENCQRYSLTFKDALYVTLAQEFQVPLVTTDMRLLNALRRFPYKLSLADYASPQR